MLDFNNKFAVMKLLEEQKVYKFNFQPISQSLIPVLDSTKN